jgi:hypothetical protein
MRPSLVRKADRMARDRAPEPRLHFFWGDLDETHDMVEARIRARIASGEASENDRFVTVSWRRSEGDGSDDRPCSVFPEDPNIPPAMALAHAGPARAGRSAC